MQEVPTAFVFPFFKNYHLHLKHKDKRRTFYAFRHNVYISICIEVPFHSNSWYSMKETEIELHSQTQVVKFKGKAFLPKYSICKFGSAAEFIQISRHVNITAMHIYIGIYKNLMAVQHDRNLADSFKRSLMMIDNIF